MHAYFVSIQLYNSAIKKKKPFWTGLRSQTMVCSTAAMSLQSGSRHALDDPGNERRSFFVGCFVLRTLGKTKFGWNVHAPTFYGHSTTEYLQIHVVVVTSTDEKNCEPVYIQSQRYRGIFRPHMVATRRRQWEHIWNSEILRNRSWSTSGHC